MLFASEFLFSMCRQPIYILYESGSLALGELLELETGLLLFGYGVSADGVTAIATSDWSYVHVSKCAQSKHNNGFCRKRVLRFKALVDNMRILFKMC